MSSSLPLNNNINIEGSEQFLRAFDYPLDDESWLLYQELLECTTAAAAGAGDYDDEIMNVGEAIINYDNQISINVDELVVENGLESMKIVGSPNKSITRKKIKRKMINDDENGEEGASIAKKLDHNAKERIRRMKINASFLALRALLPDSTRSKKRWGAPAVVDRVVKYIPEMENELQALKSKKESLQYSKAKNKDEILPTFLLNKVNEEEAIIQICMRREDYEDGLAFIRLMQSVEDEGIFINSVSALYTSDTIICCHLQIQISDATIGVDYIEQLRDKIISWLR